MLLALNRVCPETNTCITTYRSLWIGEGYSYNSDPDYWLVQMSGHIFGIFSDMLGSVNAPRGMVFGSTGRPGCVDPSPIWQFWDDFGIADTDMVGWWEPDSVCSVQVVGTAATASEKGSGGAGAAKKTPLALATAYVNPGNRTIFAVASWLPSAVNITLAVDWSRVGLDESKVTLRAPAISGFQPEKAWKVDEPILLEPGKGFLIVVK
jgi:hypothetical protein